MARARFDRWSVGYNSSVLRPVYDSAHRALLEAVAALGVHPGWMPDIGCGTATSPARVLDYITELRSSNSRDVVVVYLPEYVVGRWWEHLLHNQSALDVTMIHDQAGR